ncbi:hypothetical protein KNO81_33570 [Paraburkholderia sediminicola]|nr:hypothetical protein [Paraburkholderia sediminicola]
MFVEKQFNRAMARTGMVMATIVMVMTLTACPGGGTSDKSSAVDNAEGAATGNPSGTPGTPSTQAGFFDSIFINGSGSGYYQFGANFGGTSGKPVATGRTQFYVNGDADTNFSESTAIVLGSYQQQYVDNVYITVEGAFASRSTPYTDIGSGSRIFQRLPQGYQMGMNGMSAPFYEITLTQQDLPGQPVGQALEADKGPATNGLSILLGNDATPMPGGAQILQLSEKTLATHLWLNLASKDASGKSLEQWQAQLGGTIQTLGGYRYVLLGSGTSGAGSSAYIEYNGAIYSGELNEAGQVNSQIPAAYSRIAADFIMQEEQKVGLPQ